jgi:hypothetical protein
LEGRDCPSVSWAFDDGILEVRGNADDDTVQIAAVGETITIESEGESEEFEGVEALDIRLGGGNDELAIDLTEADDDLGLEAIDVRGGSGDDTATIDVGEIGREAAMDFGIRLGAGDDVLELTGEG